MERIVIEPLALDQKRIRYWGVVCGYCGDKPGMPVNFLPWCRLTDDERADVIEVVQEQIGPVKRTYQNRKVFDVLEYRADPKNQRQVST